MWVPAAGPHLRGSQCFGVPFSKFPKLICNAWIQLGCSVAHTRTHVAIDSSLSPSGSSSPPTRCLHVWTSGLSMAPVFLPRHLVKSGCSNRVGTGFKVTFILRQVQTSRLPVSLTPRPLALAHLCSDFHSGVPLL